MAKGTVVCNVCPYEGVIAREFSRFKITTAFDDDVGCGPHAIYDAIGSCSIVSGGGMGAVVLFKNDVAHGVALEEGVDFSFENVFIDVSSDYDLIPFIEPGLKL